MQPTDIMSARVRGLYAVTPDLERTPALVECVTRAIAGGIGLLQYRNKHSVADLRRVQAAQLMPICRRAGVPLIVNDDLELALELGADGVHLGVADGDLAAARRRLGRNRLLGASCYDRYELAVAAREAGADYVAFGSVFPSSTKPDAVRAPLALFGRAKRELRIPTVAIGGITAQNAAEVIRAGADACAVISDLFAAPDIAARAREFNSLFAAATTI